MSHSSAPAADPPRVDVLILNWNGAGFLRRFLPGVLATDYPNFQVVVADNASSDDSLALLRSEFPGVRRIEFTDNHGFAGGNNRAVAQLEAPYVVLLNSDVEVPPGWLRPLVEAMEAQPQLAALQPKVLAQGRKTHFEYAGAVGGYLDRLGYPFARGRLFDHLEADEGQYGDARGVFWATGACLMLRRAVVNETGLFDEAFFAHMEEIDFCWRAQRAGYGIAAEPRSTVYHVGGGTLPQESPFKTFLNFRNNLWMLLKNLPGRELAWVLPLRLVLDGLAGLRELLRGRPRAIWAIVKAHWAVFGRFRSMRRQTRAWPRLPFEQLGGAYRGWVILDVFVRGRTRFGELPRRHFAGPASAENSAKNLERDARQ